MKLINENELMIGNAIWNSHGYLQIINAQDLLDLNNYSNFKPERCQYFVPLKLDEELLLRNGFVEINDDGLYGSENEPLFQLQNRYLANDGFDFIFDTSIINKEENPIEYVHQLQIIYFANIGEKLKIIKL